MASRTYQPTDEEAKPFEELRKKNLERPKPLKPANQSPPADPAPASAKKESER